MSDAVSYIEPTQSDRSPNNRRLIALVVGIAVAAVAIGAGVWLWRSHSTPEGSYGTFGQTAGANVEIAPGIVALSFSEPSADGRGDIVLAGPAGVQINGTYQYTNDANWNIDVNGGTGTIGGIDLDGKSFHGSIDLVDDVVSTDVDSDMPGHPQVVSGWDQVAKFHIGYGQPVPDDQAAPVEQPPARAIPGLAQNKAYTAVQAANVKPAIPTTPGAFTGTMNITTSHGTGTLTGSGNVQSSGVYTVTFTGSLKVGTIPVTLGGTYTSAGYKGAATAVWNISGDIGAGTFQSMQVQSGHIASTNTVPDLTGTMTAVLNLGSPMTVDFAVDIVDEDNWTLTVNGTREQTWTVAAIPGLTVTEGQLHGTASASNGKTTFDLTTNNTVVVDGVTLTGTFHITSPTTFTVTVNDGSGTVLSSPSHHIDSTSGHFDYNNGVVSGSLHIQDTSQTTLILPSSWKPNTTIDFTYAKSASDAKATVTASVAYVAADNKGGTINMSGSYATPGTYKLNATGTVGIGSGGTATLTGAYESAGYVDNGTTRSAPWWNISGSLANVPMGGGAVLSSGTLAATSDAKGFTGSAYIKPSSNNTFTIATNLAYTDSSNWTFTVGVQGASPWSPNGFTNLTIDPNKLSGTVYKSSGTMYWAVVAHGVTWANMSTGVNMTSDLSVSTTCPLGSKCPGITGVYLGATNGALTFPSPLPAMTATGAILSSGGWGRFDATAGSVSFHGIGVSNTALTIWKGTRTDQYNPNLGMPDLSGSNNGLSMEFCGNFNAAIPDVTTLTTGGCIEWTPSGVVMGQVAMGGNVDSGTTSTGIKIGVTTLSGFAWSDLTTKPTISLNGVATKLTANLNTLTGNMTIPANVMKGMGNTSGKDMSFPATGWFSSGDFALDCTIPIGLSKQGVDLDSMDVHIGKSGHTFNLSFAAIGKVKIRDTKFPLTATVGLVAGSSTEVYVSVAAKGVRSANPNGTFDYPTLLTAGSFEPESTLIIDGSWDARPPSSIITHGDFENAVPQGNLIPNGDYEKYTGQTLVPNGDFEDGSYTNMVPNNDFEDTNVIINPDFEADPPTSSWGTYNGVAGVSVADAGPGETNGTYILRLHNTNSSGTKTNTGITTSQNSGLMQWWTQNTYVGQTYTIGAWVRSSDTSNARYQLGIVQDNSACTGTDTGNHSSIGTVGPTWTYVSFTVNAVACRAHIAVWINVPDANDYLDVDNLVFSMDRGTFTSYSFYNNNTDWTASNASIDYVSYPVEAHNSNNRMSLSSTSSSGYTSLDMGAAPDQYGTYTFSIWLMSTDGAQGKIRITSVGGGGTEYNDLSFNDLGNGVWKKYTVTTQFTRNDYTSFAAQVFMTSTGKHLRMDDVYVAKVPFQPYATVAGTAGQVVEYDPSGATNANTPTGIAHSGVGALSLTDENPGSNGVAAYYDTTPSGGITTGTTYTATVWMRLAAGSATGNIWLHALGGTTESINKTISPTSTWQQVTVSLPINNSGHTSLRVEFDTGGDWGTVTYDDLVVTAVNRTITQDSGDVWYDDFYASGTNTSFSVMENPDNAYANNGYITYKTNSGTPWITKAISVNGKSGSTYTFSAYVKGPSGATGKMRIATNTQDIRTPFTQGSGWAQQSASITLTSNVSTIWVSFMGSSANQTWLADNALLTMSGLTTDDPWTAWTQSSFMTAGIFADSSVAHGGSNYTEIKPVNVSSGSYLHDYTQVSPGRQYTYNTWLRSPSGTANVNVCLGSLDSGGNWIKNDCSMWSVGTSWVNAFTTSTLPSNVVTVRPSIDPQVSNTAIQIDDMTLRQDQAWTVTNSSTEMAVSDDRSNARDGSGYVRVRAYDGSGGGIQASGSSTISNGSTYTMTGFVRNTAGYSNVSGTLYVTASGGSSGSETFSLPFTTNGSNWQDLSFSFTSTKANTTFTEKIVINSAGSVDIDSLDLQPQIIIQSDPWRTTVGSGGSISYNDYNDPANAHTDKGVGVFYTGGTAASGIYHDMNATISAGSSYTVNTWWQARDGKTAAVRVCLQTLGGTDEKVCADGNATSYWGNQALTLGPLAANHTGLRVTITTTTPGVALNIDDVVVQPKTWTTFGSAGFSQASYADGAQSGSGYGYFSTWASGSGIQMTIPGNVSNGTNETVTMWVKSNDGTPINGHFKLVATGTSWSSQDYSFSAGSDWTQVTYTVPVNVTGVTGLTIKVYSDTLNKNLSIDSVDVDPNAGAEPDGITTDLPHPETGYIYLWDDAWGIKGAHLWSITAQISIIGGSPALGVGATTYYDPTVNKALVGTAWLRGSMTANISTREPCFSFDFDAGDSGTKVSIDGGVITATKFQLTIAPRGCTVGAYMLAPGSVLAFDAAFGNTTLHFDLEIGRDANGLPTFYWDQKVTNLKFGGITYNTMQLTISVNADASSVTFVGDFELPQGKFYGSFDLSASSGGILQDGDVRVTDWTMANGSFDVNTFTYHQHVVIPFGSSACGVFDANTSGDMKMGNKSYNFTGSMKVNCGGLDLLHFQFAYSKGGVSYTMSLDYDKESHVLAGSLTWNFERKMSWKFLTHRYTRHPQFGIALSFYMDFDKPADAYLTLAGHVSVSGGNGSVSCTFGGANVDDSCSLHVHVSPGGGRTYDASW